MRVLSAGIIILFFASTTLFAQDLGADGHDWLEYNQSQKLELAEAISKKLNIDTEEYPLEDIVKDLDETYFMYAFEDKKMSEDEVFEETYLDRSCVNVMRSILKRKEDIKKEVRKSRGDWY